MAKKAKPFHQKISQALEEAKAAANGGSVFKSKALTRAEMKTLSDGNWLYPIHAYRSKGTKSLMN